MQEWLINLSTHYSFWVYFIIIFTATAEGPVVSMIAGVLIKLGYFHLIPIYIALMAGDLFGDSLWYLVGRQWGHKFISRFGKYFSITEHSIRKVSKIFVKYKNRILIISKITNGFGFSLVTLLTAGMTRIPFYQYLSLNLIGQFVWSGLLIAIGYYFSGAYMAVNDIFGKIFVIALFIALLAAFAGFIKYVRNRSEVL